MIKIAAVLVSAAMGAGALFGYVATVTTATSDRKPYCPTEDSCSVRYDGRTDTWVVTEITP